jgi:hypothetical protein
MGRTVIVVNASRNETKALEKFLKNALAFARRFATTALRGVRKIQPKENR